MKALTPAQQLRFLKTWLGALVSDRYRQTSGALRKRGFRDPPINVKPGHCCLGVGCDVALTMGLVRGRWVLDDSADYSFRIAAEDRAPEHDDDLEPERYEDSTHIPRALAGRLGIDMDFQEELSESNDSGVGFQEIARIIVEKFQLKPLLSKRLYRQIYGKVA